ncbi:MAG: DUF692 family protein [Oceanospirillaceae bacterium]|nr:DUF692 family protein [Oceanospirillaceae bacterium]MCP5334636.1 DUF692 family protein [Oceanospirillaceae bacterium]MCP5351350.1 DUF692 family protein [Oceanospirillaceae bacterium]
MAGLGYRREMADWDISCIEADFFEVVPENWIRRERAPLHNILASNRPVHLHGVSLNLGGEGAINTAFLRELRGLMDDLHTEFYSDHLAASGDAHQLYDLFPIPFTAAEVRRVGDRIKQVQDVLGCAMAIENPTWYTNTGDMPEADFLSAVAEYADCRILLDLNNIDVNFKNHGLMDLNEFIRRVDLKRITYLHVAGHEFDERFGLYVDTHSQAVENKVRDMALQLNRQHKLPILLEWDNDVPDLASINRELACLHSTIM